MAEQDIAFTDDELAELQAMIRAFPVVGKLLKQNYSMSVALLWTKVQQFDRRLTRLEAMVAELRK